MNWTRGHTIGHGSSATVSVAKSHLSGEVFAVKTAELDRSKFLQREQGILSLLKCQQVVGYIGHDITSEKGKFMYNLFMEYVSGGTLSNAIQMNGGRLEECTIRYHTREILHGLSYLHSNHLVHCDIKGQNILIGLDGAKIGDLGCARWVDSNADKAVSTTFSIAGTPLFMAPEVARGEEQTFPADVWALGCTVIEMATGCPPWPEVDDPVSALFRIAFSGDVPEFPSFLSEQAKDFLSKCLRRDPKDRWTANQLLQHPFLDESNSHSKEIQDSKKSNSPTSILDQDFWDSMEESETPRNLTHIGSSNSAQERVRLLSSPSPKTCNWTWDEDWVTLRNSNSQESENSRDEDRYTTQIDEPTTTSSGSDTVWISREEEMEFCGSSVFEKDSLNYSVNNFSNGSSRRNLCNRKGCVNVCRCLCSDLNFETQRLSVFF